MLIDNWRQSWRFLSIQLGVIGTTIASVLIAFPDAALHAWALLPADLKALMPPQYTPLIGVAIFVISMLARLFKQRKLEEQRKAKEPPQ